MDPPQEQEQPREWWFYKEVPPMTLRFVCLREDGTALGFDLHFRHAGRIHPPLTKERLQEIARGLK